MKDWTGSRKSFAQTEAVKIQSAVRKIHSFAPENREFYSLRRKRLHKHFPTYVFSCNLSALMLPPKIYLYEFYHRDTIVQKARR